MDQPQIYVTEDLHQQWTGLRGTSVHHFQQLVCKDRKPKGFGLPRAKSCRKGGFLEETMKGLIPKDRV
jgi:hypothetical protein